MTSKKTWSLLRNFREEIVWKPLTESRRGSKTEISTKIVFAEAFLQKHQMIICNRAFFSQEDLVADENILRQVLCDHLCQPQSGEYPCHHVPDLQMKITAAERNAGL